MKKFNLAKGLVIGLLTLALVLIGFATVKASAAGDYPEVKCYASFNSDDTMYESTQTDITASGWGALGIANKVSASGDAYLWNLGGASEVTSFTTEPETYADCVSIVDGKIKVKTKAECEALHDDFGESLVEGCYFRINCVITIPEAAYPATTFTITIDEKDYVYTKAAGTAAKAPRVTKEELLAGAKNDGKSLSDEYEDIVLTKTTADNGSAYKYSNGNTDIRLSSEESLALAFTATGTPKGSGEEPTPTPTPAPTGVVSFIVHVQCADTDVAGDYELESSLSAKDDSITLAEILEAAEKAPGEGAEEGAEPIKLDDASAWILDTRAGKSKDFLKSDVNLSFTAADGTIKVKKALTADTDVDIYVVPAKVNITFTVTVGEVLYKSTFAVENGAKAKTKISYADIAANLKGEKAPVAEGEEAEVVTLDNQVVTKIGSAAQTGDYSKSVYEVANNEIKDADFADVAIVVADAFTANTGYDPETDSLFFESPVQVTVYWADVKKAGGAQLKGDKLKTLALKLDTESKKYVGSIPLNDKDAGVKIAESKTAYIYASIKAPAEGKASYKANFIVDATPYKKIAVTFRYAQADKNLTAVATDYAIATLTTVAGKTSKTYSGVYNAETNAENYLTGGTNNILDTLQYSTDGETWYKVINNGAVKVNGKDTNVDFNLDMLYGLVNDSGTTLYFRIKGAAATPAQEAVEANAELGTEAQEAVAAKNAYRATKPIKAKVVAAKETKAVKINVATGTLALKNGYDFIVGTSDKETDIPAVTNAHTILPFNKGGKATATVSGEEVATYLINTGSFIPSKKCTTATAKMFTNIKVKSVLIENIVGKENMTSDMYIWIRKSATEAKPADKWVCIKLAKVTGAPSIAKSTDPKGEFYSAQDKDDKKGVIATPTITAASGDSGTTFEYLIVNASDYENGEFSVDFTSAKWTTLTDKGLTVGKSKSKYAKSVGAKAGTAVLKDGSIVLVRRAGDKSSSILPSNYIMTMVAKQDVQFEVENAEGKKEKKDISVYVWKAYSAQ